MMNDTVSSSVFRPEAFFFKLKHDYDKAICKDLQRSFVKRRSKTNIILNISNNFFIKHINILKKYIYKRGKNLILH